MKRLTLLFGAFILLVSCSGGQIDHYDVVPYPNDLTPHSGSFAVVGVTLNIDSSADEATIGVISEFATQLGLVSGGENTVNVVDNASKAGGMCFVVDASLPDEGYVLDVNKSGVKVAASKRAGFFYAIQTMKQLLPVEIYGTEVAKIDWSLPCVSIKDNPRFAYRGMMLDVARHFFSIEEVKRYIDIMSIYKLNVFHWHLSDDQGWRIEIKKYPGLTEIGSIRKKTMIKKEWDNYDTTPYGGFYTQDQIREIVKYAADRSITVVPEIDLPGHMMAALAAYPELGCTGGPYDVSGQWGVRDEVLCPGKEKTFEFIEGVLDEVMELFPSEYINIGGDECPKIRWEKCPKCQARIKALGLKSTEKYSAEHYLQSYVTARVEKYLADHGRHIIGWDEILEGEIAPTATVLAWRGNENGIEGARLGHDVIMCPTSHFYLDYYQSLDIDDEPFGIGGYVPIEKVYSYNPQFAELTADEQKHIIGVQANMWTEYIATGEHLEYMLLPRMAALSEVQWCFPENKNWERFAASVPHMARMYDIMGYNYARTMFEVQASWTVNPQNQTVDITLSTVGDAPIYYTLDGSEPTDQSALYKEPIELRDTRTVKAVVKRDDIHTRTYARQFVFNKATGHGATLNLAPEEKYTYKGASVLTDGIRGDMSYATGAWLGYKENPVDVTIDMGKTPAYSRVKLGVLINKIDWIFPPVKILVSTSSDNMIFSPVGILELPAATAADKDTIVEYEVEIPATTAPYVRVEAYPVDKIPVWHAAAGEKAYLFIDEIVVE